MHPRTPHQSPPRQQPTPNPNTGHAPPTQTDEGKKEKRGERQRGVRRQIQRLFSLLESGQTIPAEVRPDDVTLAEWIRHCKRTGLYAQGKLLYERAGLNLDKLSEEEQVNAICWEEKTSATPTSSGSCRR